MLTLLIFEKIDQGRGKEVLWRLLETTGGIKEPGFADIEKIRFSVDVEVFLKDKNTSIKTTEDFNRALREERIMVAQKMSSK